MASTSHLKRNSMPASWPVKKKNITFTTKPNPGSHKREYVTPIVILLRDFLGYAATAKEVKQIVHNEEILINNKKVNDIKTACGLFDIIEIKKTNKKFILLFNELGRLKLVPAKDDLIYLRVSGKKVLGNAKFQLNFMNGFNIVVDKKVFSTTKVNDTIVYDLSKNKVKSVLNLKEGSFVYIFDGKFQGKFAEVKSFTLYNGISKDIANIEINSEEASTIKDYCYVIGTKKSDLVRFE